MKKNIAWAALMVFGLTTMMPSAMALDVSDNNLGFEYFYVFGPDAKPTKGAEDHVQNVYVDVPANAPEDVVINIYDPDTYKKPDVKGGWRWDTATTFSVQGTSTLDQITIEAKDKTYHKKYFTFGPYPKTSGRKVGSFYRFKVGIEAVQGNDGNLFNVDVTPRSAETFSENITFRLISGRGNKMHFFPEVQDGTRRLYVENYDLDRSGGTSVLYDPHSKKMYEIRDSTTGAWAETTVDLEPGPARRLAYIITKGYQINGNAGLKIRDDKGQLIPIYFQGPPPVIADAPKRKPAPMPEPKRRKPNACNRFVFDARSSFDPNNDKITYLWDFGDGRSSTEPVVTHEYDKGGMYKVRLTVSDNSGLECQTSVTTQDVKVNTPPTAAFSGPEKTCTGSSITFNASATQDDQPANLTYHWAFSDGTEMTGQTVSRKFDSGGVYDVVLTVDDNEGTICSTDSIRQTVYVNAPPLAEAGEDVTLFMDDSNAEYRVTFDGSASRDGNNDQLTYLWNFGDGQRAEGKRVEHTYAQPGNYKVKLTVDDNSGSSCAKDSDMANVTLNKAPLAEAGEPKYACIGSSITFDAAGSRGETGETLSFNWDFGDGASGTGQVVKHSYNQSGKYPVTLIVDDGRNTPVSQSIDVVEVTINAPPRVRIDSVEKSCVGDKVVFDASSSEDPDGDRLSYTWDFGDGTVVEGGSKMSHRYEKGGRYKVRVTADDGRGAPCSVSSATVNAIVNTPPVANTGPNLACCQDQQTQFNGSESFDPDGDRLSFQWDFGDGQGAKGSSVNHAYSESGNYNVVLTVDDGSGTMCSSSSSGFTADVNAKPVPVIKIQQA